MQPLYTEQLLSLWEQSSTLSPARKALLLLEAACPDQQRQELAQAPVGERDRMLLRLRRWAFGEDLECRPHCPRCATELESKFATRDLLAEPNSPIATQELAIVEDGWRISCRLLNSADLLALESAPGIEEARTLLLARAVTAAEHNGLPTAASELPAHLVARVSEALEAHDPLANVQLEFTCPGCSLRWQQIFDVVAFFWSEIDAWAIRVLRRVDTLARVYGWSEREILALSPARAQLYMQMATGS